MPTRTEKYPVHLRVVISKTMQSDLASMAKAKSVPVAELVRNLLAAYLADEFASKGQMTVRRAVRVEIRPEFKRIADRLGSLGAKTVIAAGTAEQLMVDILEKAVSSGGTPESRKLMARMMHEEARKKAVIQLKKSVPEEDDDNEN